MAKVYNVDAWASPDGWDINDRRFVGNLELSRDASCEDILNALYEKEYIVTNDKEKIVVEDWVTGAIAFNAKTGEPLYEIDFEEE